MRILRFSVPNTLAPLPDYPQTVPPSWHKHNTVQRARCTSSGPHGILPLVISQYMTCVDLPAPDTGANSTSLSTLRGIVTNALHGHNPLTMRSSLTWSWDEDGNNLGRYWWFGVTGILKGA